MWYELIPPLLNITYSSLSRPQSTVGPMCKMPWNSTKGNSRTKQFVNIACRPNRLDFKGNDWEMCGNSTPILQ